MPSSRKSRSSSSKRRAIGVNDSLATEGKK
jgi:hypothetical protein